MQILIHALRSTAIISLTLSVAAQPQTPASLIPGQTAQLGNLTVSVSSTRLLVMEARSPMVTAFRDGTHILTCGNPVRATNLRSTDAGQWWQPQTQYFGWLNTVELATGLLNVTDYNLVPVTGQPGWYTVTRYTSNDKGLTLQGPFRDGRAHLPTSVYGSSLVHWVNDILQLPNGDLLAAVQNGVAGGVWTTTVVESKDNGVNWLHKSVAINRDTINDPTGRLQQNGWPLYWASEPALVHAGGNNLICVARTSNDETRLPTTQIGPAMTKFQDLSHTVQGDGIASSIMTLPASQYFSLGPENAPLVLALSNDAGASWSRAVPMTRARGVFPRLAHDGSGLVALTYGGLSGVPRWGNAIVFSTDAGASWSNELVLQNGLTTGYTDVVAVGPGHFVVYFDWTSPQAFRSYQRFWVGVVDVFVQ